MRFVLDASMALAFVLHDEHDELATRILADVRRATLLVPTIWRAEVLNALLNAQRRKRIDAAGVQEGIALIDGLNAQVDPQAFEMQAVLDLAIHHKLTIYDALYLDLASREGIGLATRDSDLVRAAKAANVKIL